MNEWATAMVESLIGRGLWDSTRAADMEMFQFGARVTSQDFRGKTRTVGELALHLQCAWRIVSLGRVLVGDRDLWTPRTGVSDVDFHPTEVAARLSRRDELMERFLGHGEPAHVVAGVNVSPVGDLHLSFADGCSFDAFSDLGYAETVGEEAPDECWRLFSPSTDAEHLVIWAGGVVDD